MTAIILALVLAVSGGTAFAAEGSLPGDALYPVKVGINEQVRAGLAFSAEAKAEVQADLAERRLSEAERLAARGSLSEEHLARLEHRFEAHAERVRARIQQFEDSDRAEAASNVSARLEASLRAHEQILLRLSGDVDGEVEPNVRLILQRVREHLTDAERSTDRLEDRVADRPRPDIKVAAEAKKEVAVKYIASVEGFMARQGDELSEEQALAVSLLIEQANGLVVQGDAELASEEYGAAFRLYQQAHQAAIRAHLTLRASAHISEEARLRIESRVEQDESRLRSEIRVEVKDDDGTGENGDDGTDNDSGDDVDQEQDSSLRLREELRSRLGI
jgi:hypothetical protein